MRIPSYIVKHANGIYYFRYVIPKHDTHLFPNKREIRRSLATRSRNEAIKLARIYWYKVMVDKTIPSLETQITEWELKLRNGKRIKDELAAFEKNYQNNFDSTDQDEFIAQLSNYDIDCLTAIEEYEKSKKAPPPSSTTLIEPKALTTNTKLLSTVFDEFIVEKGDLPARTVRGYQRHFNLFIKITSILYLLDLNIEVVREYKQTIRLIPPNINQNKELAGLTINEILNKQPFEKTLSGKSINLCLTFIQSFLKWLFTQQYLDSDLSGILNDIRNRSTKKEHEHRTVFTSEDLTKLFGIEEYQSTGFRKYSFRFWIPLLGLYTGARIN